MRDGEVPSKARADTDLKILQLLLTGDKCGMKLLRQGCQVVHEVLSGLV